MMKASSGLVILEGGGSKENDEGFVWSCYIGGWRAAKIMMKALSGLVILEGGGQQRE